MLGISFRYFREGGFYQGEYYFLLLTSFLGCVMMPSSRDMLMLFIALELVSAPGFLMAAFRKNDPKSNEAGLKFFLIGVLSTAVMLYGMSLIYGLTGDARLDEIAPGSGRSSTPRQETLAFARSCSWSSGSRSRCRAVPFQFWAPDTYEGAPVPVAAFLAVASSAAGFAGLLQLMFVAFIDQHAFWTPIFAVLSIATMTLGNLVALKQRRWCGCWRTRGSRRRATSCCRSRWSRATPSSTGAFAAAVAYILIYAIMNLGAFAVTIAVAARARRLLITDFAGLAGGRRVLAVAMTAFMVSLAGIPPTGGFWAKFLDLPGGDRARRHRVWLAVIMLVNSVVSLVLLLRRAEADDLRGGRARAAGARRRRWSPRWSSWRRGRGGRRRSVPEPARPAAAALDADRQRRVQARRPSIASVGERLWQRIERP